MAWTVQNMTPLKYPGHSSVCAICSDQELQTGYVLGFSGFNLSAIKVSAIVNNYWLESALCRCPKCDFAYFFPRPPSYLLEKFYCEGGGGTFTLNNDDFERRRIEYGEAKSRVDSVISRLSSIGLQISRDQRILEIGAGLSSYADHFLKKGCEYIANEPGKHQADFLERVYGIRTLRTMVEEISDEFDFYFDYVISTDSFEHHLDPKASFLRVSRLLRDGGHFILSVPNLNSYSLKTISIAHPYFAFPPHLNYFSCLSLEVLCGISQLSPVLITTFTHQGELFYCNEMLIKLGLIKLDDQHLNALAETGSHERILLVAKKVEA